MLNHQIMDNNLRKDEATIRNALNNILYARVKDVE